MANKYMKIYLQIVFAVKGRQSLIQPTWEDELHKYMTGIIQGKKQKLLAINGMPDHIHIFIDYKGHILLEDLVREVKKASNAFIKEKKFTPYQFSWQSGYGAFSYSNSQKGKVMTYIQKQKEHHRKHTFKEEYLKLLELFEIDFKEEYVFDFIKNPYKEKSD